MQMYSSGSSIGSIEVPQKRLNGPVDTSHVLSRSIGQIAATETYLVPIKRA